MTHQIFADQPRAVSNAARPELIGRPQQQSRGLERARCEDWLAKALDHTREEMSAHAPRIETMQVPKDKIRDVIGTGGKVIREIVA